MIDNPRGLDRGNGTDVDPGHESAPRTPRWVIVLGIIAVILLLAVVAQFVLGIQHGPGMHGPP